ncbi:hypothetical protein N7532_000177 [Penicillium argentinense]|uniref:Uncharacterized protein n=1 Tax=Penicillium argentinense TaxID=1131581 RepID=A0A9W9G696_9EURO|nr:uncharacterized protein N7532_000177 [Penicillium argentinense]KAJ5112132.1 hypothetical protein N7532_000177 [Penicillium argentinense]
MKVSGNGARITSIRILSEISFAISSVSKREFGLLSELYTPNEGPYKLTRGPAEQPYNIRAGESSPHPTEAQISEILHPARLEALRPYAAFFGSLGEGLWLRLCYDEANEEKYEAVWTKNEDSDFVCPDGIILDDKEIFNGRDLARTLELIPNE